MVEDELALREGVSDLLRGDGHEVVAAADGEEGAARGVAEAFDVVVLDVMLPRLGRVRCLPTPARRATRDADPHADGARRRG